MDYDSVEDTVKDVRLSLMENMGLLECKNGLTAKGHKYIYAIRKNSGDGAGPAETGGIVSGEPECECRRG